MCLPVEIQYSLIVHIPVIETFNGGGVVDKGNGETVPPVSLLVTVSRGSSVLSRRGTAAPAMAALKSSAKDGLRPLRTGRPCPLPRRRYAKR